jgi:magnesium transporter
MLTTPRRWWLHARDPDLREQATLIEGGAPRDFVRHALDAHEQSRVEHDDAGATLIVLRVPDGAATGGRSTPLSVVLRAERLVTIALHPLALVEALAARVADDTPPADVLPELVHAVAARFVEELDRIDDRVEALEQSLKTSLRNEEVLGLLDCQKSLVHLERALASNQATIERLRADAAVPLDDAARRRLDEALVEVRQAAQMTTISAEILASMMDAFASIISNNLNHVMKLLAALTIIVSIPTMVAGLWGMNVPLPGGGSPWAFAALVGGLAAGSLAVALLFRKRRWL